MNSDFEKYPKLNSCLATLMGIADDPEANDNARIAACTEVRQLHLAVRSLEPINVAAVDGGQPSAVSNPALKRLKLIA